MLLLLSFSYPQNHQYAAIIFSYLDFSLIATLLLLQIFAYCKSSLYAIFSLIATFLLSRWNYCFFFYRSFHLIFFIICRITFHSSKEPDVPKNLAFSKTWRSIKKHHCFLNFSPYPNIGKRICVANANSATERQEVEWQADKRKALMLNSNGVSPFFTFLLFYLFTFIILFVCNITKK